MTRKEILKMFKVSEHGIIVQPGMFEGEPLYIVHFRDLVCGDGGGEDDFTDINGNIVDVFHVEKSEYDEFPEIGNTQVLWVWVDNQGFVQSREFQRLSEEVIAREECEGTPEEG